MKTQFIKGSSKVSAKQAGTSSRAVQLHHLKNEARRIRQAHSAGEITAEEAARQLSELHSKDRHRIFGFYPTRQIYA
jgi:hypothetical protein